MSATDTATVAPELTPEMHLTYQGNQSSLVGRVLGPNVRGEYWGAVDVTYDAASNVSRVGIVHIDNPDTYRGLKALEDGPETAPPGVHRHNPPAVAFCAYCAFDAEDGRL